MRNSRLNLEPGRLEFSLSRILRYGTNSKTKAKPSLKMMKQESIANLFSFMIILIVWFPLGSLSLLVSGPATNDQPFGK